MNRIVTAAVLLLSLAATGSANVVPPQGLPRGKCRVECRQAVRGECLFPHPGMLAPRRAGGWGRRGAMRRCLRVCLYGGETSTICPLPPLVHGAPASPAHVRPLTLCRWPKATAPPRR